MNPLEKRVQELENIVNSLVRVENVPFIESAKRRIVPKNLDEVVSKNTIGSTSGVLKAVNEGGTDTYNVADAFDGTITLIDQQGNTYKLGYYN